MDVKESDEESAADALWRSAENLVPSNDQTTTCGMTT